jgi:hypothetical protein
MLIGLAELVEVILGLLCQLLIHFNMIPFILTIIGGYLIGDSMKGGEKFADGGEIEALPFDYYDPKWYNLSYDEQVEAEKKRLEQAGIEIGDIVTKPEGNMALWGTVTLYPKSDSGVSQISPIMVEFDDTTKKATGSKKDRIEGYKLYLKKDTAQMFGPKKKKK